MDCITVVNFLLSVIVFIKANKRLTILQAIICANLIYVLAHSVSVLVNVYFNSISTDNIFVKSLIDVFRPYTIDSIWEETVPVIFGLLFIAIIKSGINKVKQFMNAYSA